jgi:hypothetical protein
VKSPTRLLMTSCFLTLVALGLMAWSVLDPRPIPVITAMSLGQVLGTLSLGLFLYVVSFDLRRRLTRSRDGPATIPPRR